jgi:hypothetical protein
MKVSKLKASILLAAALLSNGNLSAQTSVENNEFIVPVDGRISGKINGSPLLFVVAANGIESPLLNPGTAEELTLKKSLLPVEGLVGREKVRGSTSIAQYELGGIASKKRSFWFDRPIVEGANAQIGPTSLSHRIVTFQIGPKNASEQRYSLPMAEQGNSIGTLFSAAGNSIFVLWDLQSGDSVATAAAAQAITEELGGVFKGETTARVIKFGITRPIRKLHLDRTLAIGPVKLDDLAVRVADYGSVEKITDVNLDPNEIVVKATGKKQKAVFQLVIGRDALAGCSTLTFDKVQKSVHLSCAT